jgi:hypothetical protein
MTVSGDKNRKQVKINTIRSAVTLTLTDKPWPEKESPPNDDVPKKKDPAQGEGKRPGPAKVLPRR